MITECILRIGSVSSVEEHNYWFGHIEVPTFSAATVLCHATIIALSFICLSLALAIFSIPRLIFIENNFIAVPAAVADGVCSFFGCCHQIDKDRWAVQTFTIYFISSRLNAKKTHTHNKETCVCNAAVFWLLPFSCTGACFHWEKEVGTY